MEVLLFFVNPSNDEMVRCKTTPRQVAPRWEWRHQWIDRWNVITNEWNRWIEGVNNDCACRRDREKVRLDVADHEIGVQRIGICDEAGSDGVAQETRGWWGLPHRQKSGLKPTCPGPVYQTVAY